MPAIEFQLDLDKTREALAYLAWKSPGGLDKYRACKLLFLADKYHLVKYGRTITGDVYYALPLGPAPTRTLNILNMALENPDSPPPLVAALSIDRSYRDPRFSAERAELDN